MIFYIKSTINNSLQKQKNINIKTRTVKEDKTHDHVLPGESVSKTITAEPFHTGRENLKYKEHLQA